MVTGPIGLLADLHGNLPALEAVLDELKRRDVTRIFVAGDLLLGGEQPVEVFKRLNQVGAECVRGASDAALATLSETKIGAAMARDPEKAERFKKTRAALGELVIKYLGRLPDSLRIPLSDGREIVLVHGSPADPLTEITHDMSDDEILALIADDPADIIACGGSHVPFQRDVDELRVLGLGSVGASPEGGVAHFAIVTPRMEGTIIEQAWVRYAGEEPG